MRSTRVQSRVRVARIAPACRQLLTRVGYRIPVGLPRETRVAFTVQITSNLTFTRACSQNPCECASSTRERAYTARERNYYTRSYIRASCEWRAREHCQRKYYTRTYGPRMCAHVWNAHAYLYSCAGTRTILALARAHSYCICECSIDLSRALAPPSELSANEC